MAVRKNQAALTSGEKRSFVNALLELKRSGGYDEFVRIHNEFIIRDTDFGDRFGHRAPSFLPWHRWFLILFERRLQELDSSVTLPYWDWAADRTVMAPLWNTGFLGGNGRDRDAQVMTGPFAYSAGQWPITVSTDSRPYLQRAFGAGGRRLPTPAEVRSVLAMPTYDMPPWNSASEGFRNHLEGWRGVNLHNRVHIWIGGQMATGASPNDPVFWLHHSYLDKLWAEWQREHPASSYLPVDSTPNVAALHDVMRPWDDITPADVLDHTRFYTYDRPA